MRWTIKRGEEVNLWLDGEEATGDVSGDFLRNPHTLVLSLKFLIFSALYKVTILSWLQTIHKNRTCYKLSTSSLGEPSAFSELFHSSLTSSTPLNRSCSTYSCPAQSSTYLLPSRIELFCSSFRFLNPQFDQEVIRPAKTRPIQLNGRFKSREKID